MITNALRVVLLIAAGCHFHSVSLADPPEIILWPDGVPEPIVASDPAEKTETGPDGLTRRYNVSNPRLFVHIPKAQAATNEAKLRAAVIVVPGGGFTKLADEHEGSDACRWLNENRIVAFQLAYRAPTNKQPQPETGPVLDLIRAIRIVRSRADEFQVDANRIGVLGFSAGGQTAFIAAANESSKADSSADAASKPNAVLLIYPWKIWDEERDAVHAAATLDAAFPPTFIAQAADDKTSSAVGSAKLFVDLTKLKVPVEFHVYHNGGHGFGMRPRSGAPGTSDWKDRARDWLELQGFIGS
jgi:acetyl esterase/lipase